jgi:PAS domain S-box-containing protein
MSDSRKVWIGGAVFILAASFLVLPSLLPQPSTRTIRVGIDRSPPYSDWNAEGKPVGLMVEILEEAARRNSLRLEWVRTPHAAEVSLGQGLVDLWPGLARTPERLAQLHITKPWLRNDFCLISLAGKGPHSTAKRVGYPVSFVDGPVTRYLASQYLPGVVPKPASSRQTALEVVCRGEVDAAFMEMYTAQSLLLSRPKECAAVHFELDPVRGASRQLGIASSLRNAALADSLREKIEDLRADGTFAKALAYWNPFSVSETEVLFKEQEQRHRTALISWWACGGLMVTSLLVWQNRRVSKAKHIAEMANAALQEGLEQVRDAHQRLRFQVERMPLACIVWDRDLHVREWNPAAERIFGWTAAEAHGRSAGDFLAPSEAQPHLQEGWEKLLEGGEASYSLNENVDKNGKRLICEWFSASLRDRMGNVVGFLSMGHDITDRKRAEEALKESEANFRTFFESMTDMIVVGTPEGRILHSNAAFSKTLGYDAEERTAMHVRDIHPPDKRAEAEAIFTAMFRGERDVCPLPLARKDGSLVPVETRVWSGRWNGAECVFGIAKNLTAEQEAQQRFERLFRHNPALMALSALPEQQLIDVNDAWEAATGYSRSEAIGKTADELGLYAHPEQQKSLGDRLQVEGRVADFELRIRSKDGTMLDGLFSGEMISSQGKPYFLTVMIDITERKSAERKLADERQRLSHIIEGTRVGTWEWNVQTQETVFSENWAQILGYTLAELAPVSIKTWEALAHPDDLKQSGELLARHFSEELPYYDCECRMRHKAGHWVWVQDRGLVISRTDDGKPLMMFGTHMDITERKRSEEKLIHFDALMRYIIEHDRSAIAVHDKDLKYIYVSQRYLADHKLKEQDVIGRHHYEVFPDLPQRWKDIHQRALAGEVSSAEDDPFIRPDGSVDWTRWECRPWYEADGSIGGIIRYTEVITERKRAVDALRESEERYKALFERSLDCVFLTDFEGQFLDANQAALDLLGYRREDIPTLTFGSLLTDDQLPLALQTTKEVSATGRQRSLTEYRLRRKDGGYVFVETQSSLIYREGKPYALQGIARDITERKRTQEELAQSQKIVSVAQLAAHFAVFKWDAKTGKYSWFPETFQFCDLDPATTEPSFDAWLQTVHPDDRDRILREFQQTLDSPEGILNIEYRSPDGLRWIAGAGQLYRDADGKPDHMIGINIDITQRQRAEAERENLWAQLTQAQKMESIGRLAGGIAHDFNNLLTVISGYSQLALAKLSADDPLGAKLVEILKAGERAAGLTRQLLAFSRKQVLEPRRLDLNRVVEDMRPMLERLVGEDVEVRLALDAERATVHADPHQLEQVIMNLAVNARDAMPGGGRLLIETAGVERDESYARLRPEARAGRYVMLAVSDSGIGMDDETRQRIFEPFFTTKGTGQGTGLGLSMVQGIVAQSGGYIDVYSEPGQGTTFKIYLPGLAEAAPYEGRPAAVPVRGGKETVLVVEDEREVRKYAVAVLKAYGYRVIQAENAAEALLACEHERGRIHLVLTDVVMPNVSGRELASRLGKLRPGIKVLFMSGYTNDVISNHGFLEAGAEFIQKPFSPEELAGKVREVLGPPVPAGRILVGDDEAGVRGFLRAVLEQAGYEVIEAAADRNWALQQARAGQVDLVITDLVMPEQKGIESIRLLRRDVPGVGIIAISDAFGGEFPHTAQLLGADAVLCKPVNADQLLAKVAEVLKSPR